MKKITLFIVLVSLFIGACGQSASQTFNKIIIATKGIQFGDGTIQLTAGGGGGSMIYPAVGIPVSTGNSWSTSIINNSANWNTAFSWGNHSGLYRPITWVPSWNDITNKPVQEELSVALTSLPGLNIPSMTTTQINALTPTGVVIVYDSTVGAIKIYTGTVWKVIILSD